VVEARLHKVGAGVAVDVGREPKLVVADAVDGKDALVGTEHSARVGDTASVLVAALLADTRKAGPSGSVYRHLLVAVTVGVDTAAAARIPDAHQRRLQLAGEHIDAAADEVAIAAGDTH